MFAVAFNDEPSSLELLFISYWFPSSLEWGAGRGYDDDAIDLVMMRIDLLFKNYVDYLSTWSFQNCFGLVTKCNPLQ